MSEQAQRQLAEGLIDKVDRLEAENATLKQERDAANERADSIEANGLSNCCREDGIEPCEPFKKLEKENIDLLVERDRLRRALQGGFQKLKTYEHVYTGDKELRRLLDEWRSVLSPSETEEGG